MGRMVVFSLPDLPVQDGSAVAVKNGTKVVESTGNIEISDINVPVFMRGSGLNKARSLLGGLSVPGVKAPSGFENSIGGRRTHTGDISINHHEGKAAIAVERVFGVKIQDGLALCRVKPMGSWDIAIVFIGGAITLLPFIKFTPRHTNPFDKKLGRNVSFLRPMSDKINHFIT